jgi:hypothetical protein
MACKLCDKKPIRVMRRMDRDINEGNLSIVQVADKYGIPAKRVRIHMKKCLGGVPQTGYSLLQRNLRSLRSLYREVKDEYDDISPYDEGSEQRKGHAMRRMLDIRREEREHVMALDRIKPADQVVNEILNSVATPLVISTTDICTNELARLRKELTAQLGEEAYVRIDSAIKTALARIGELLTQEVNQITPNLNKILNTEHGQRKSRSSGSQDARLKDRTH